MSRWYHAAAVMVLSKERPSRVFYSLISKNQRGWHKSAERSHIDTVDPVMQKPEVHTVIPSLSEAEHAESDPKSVTTSKSFVVYTVYWVCLPMSICVLKAECVFGLRADPGPASSSRDLCRLHLWVWSVHTHAAHPTDKHSYCLAANIICANISKKRNQEWRQAPAPDCADMKRAVEQYHHKFKYFSTRLVLPYKGKATPLWELQLKSANSTKGQLTPARGSPTSLRLRTRAGLHKRRWKTMRVVLNT